MTNKEKFIEIFGVEPDIDNCPILCAANDFDCPYVKTYCYSGKWWEEEYKENNE